MLLFDTCHPHLIFFKSRKYVAISQKNYALCSNVFWHLGEILLELQCSETFWRVVQVLSQRYSPKVFEFSWVSELQFVFKSALSLVQDASGVVQKGSQVAEFQEKTSNFTKFCIKLVSDWYITSAVCCVLCFCSVGSQMLSHLYKNKENVPFFIHFPSKKT